MGKDRAACRAGAGKALSEMVALYFYLIGSICFMIGTLILMWDKM